MGKKLVFSLPALEMLLSAEQGLEYDGDEVAMGVEAPNSEPSSPIMQAVQLATIPETKSPGRSKRRADTMDESSLERVERIKAAHNLDFKGKPDSTQLSFLQFSKDDVISNLDAVGINLGHDYTTIDSSISNLRHVKLDRLVCKPKVDLIEDIFDEEEKEEMGNEEVDKLILNSLCSEIMDEVMDLGNAYPNGCNITPRARSSSTPTDSAKRKKQKRSV
jgi:hypothetical protein